MLSRGPRHSREVLAELAAQGFTAKQLRRARERQGILIERAGNGLAMHSTWRLPDAAATAPAVTATRPLVPRPSEQTPFPASTPACPQSVTLMADGEQCRHAARVRAFMSLGQGEATAHQVADALVERDRRGEHGTGSGAECQNPALGNCPTAPRPVIEAHGCWAGRQCTP